MKKVLILFILGFLFVNIHSQDSFTNDYAFLAYFKITKIPLKIEETKKFIQRYHNNELRKNSVDEFAQNDYIQKYYKSLIGKIDSFDLSKNYLTGFMFQLGDYDFDKKGFPIIWDEDFVEGKINPDNGYSGSYDYIGKAININDYRFLPMEYDKAKSLINQLQLNRNSERQILGIICISLTGKTDKYTYDQIVGIKRFTGYTLCKIDSISINVKGFEHIELKK